MAMNDNALQERIAKTERLRNARLIHELAVQPLLLEEPKAPPKRIKAPVTTAKTAKTK